MWRVAFKVPGDEEWLTSGGRWISKGMVQQYVRDVFRTWASDCKFRIYYDPTS